ncbi:MAG TPA: SDR family NAD(P)-dependent oxidoreductase [Sphingomonas sp.]|nr:SDR family NAD(P)-dependent oxidoreductase [Sphingomonas sp.]
MRTVLVTGGARRLGAAIVRALAAAGHRVVVHHHRSGDAAAALVEELGRAAVTVSADLGDEQAVRGLIPAAAEAAGAIIDGLVNCASVFEFDRPPLDDLALLQRLTAVNLGAPVLLASAFARQPGLADGAVVNVLDQKVANLNPDFFSYTCTKVALAGATEMLAQALAPAVRVNAVAPGLTLPSGEQTEAEFEAVSRENLLRRRVDAAEIGRAVEFLLTSRSITGQTVFVDCGQRFLRRDGDVMFETRRRP